MRGTGLAVLAACLVLGVSADALAGQGRTVDWRRVASDADRTRLRNWRATWIAALSLRPSDAVARDPALFDPDRALATAMPPVGRYRCRLHHLPGRAAMPMVVDRWQPCAVSDAGGRVRLAMEGGVRRPAGVLYPDTDGRAVFLGAVAIGEERRALGYGRDRLRDTAGFVERIGPRRWRLVIPGTRLGAALELMELEPA